MSGNARWATWAAYGLVEMNDSNIEQLFVETADSAPSIKYFYDYKGDG